MPVLLSGWRRTVRSGESVYATLMISFCHFKWHLLAPQRSANAVHESKIECDEPRLLKPAYMTGRRGEQTESLLTEAQWLQAAHNQTVVRLPAFDCHRHWGIVTDCEWLADCTTEYIQRFLSVKRCSNAQERLVANRYGLRALPRLTRCFGRPLPVEHQITPIDQLYNDTLWMNVDMADSQARARDGLWFEPSGVTLLLNDHIDLALALGVSTAFLNAPNTRNYETKAAMFRNASALSNIETIMFAAHVSWKVHWDCRGRCCDNTSRFRQAPRGKQPNREQTRLKAEVVGLHSWQPTACPAHPALRRGKRQQKCACRTKNGDPVRPDQQLDAEKRVLC